MKYPINLKRGPLSLIRNIIFTEIAAALLLVFSAYLFNVESFLHYTLARIIRYDFSLVLAASALQLIITLALFFKWNNESYEIREKEIIRKKGIFSVIQTSFSVSEIKEVIYKQNLLEKLTNCGTVILKDSKAKRVLALRNIENAEVIADVFRSLTGKSSLPQPEKERKLSVLDLVLSGEAQNLELKESFRWDGQRRVVNKDLEKTVMKTIASFLNLEGGKLIIGVSDDKSIRGLDVDYQSLPRQDRDGFENHFNHIFNTALGARFRQFVKLNFEEINGRDVCLVDVLQADGPVYLRTNDAEEFFVRTGNTTASLKMSEATDYIKSHWRES